MNWRAVLAAALCLALYLRSPIDLIPDRLGPLGLLDDLIVLLLALWWFRRQLGQPAPHRSRGARGPAAGTRVDDADAARADDDPYSILGVEHDASPEEITRAYREQMKRYHPDRVGGLGEELQRLAHEKTLEIQRAYEALGKR
jgi:uncharacterized membrane protein YkvA (DUF1232 family)